VKISFFGNADKVNTTALKLMNNRSNLEVKDILLSGTWTVGTTTIIKSTPKTETSSKL